MNEVQELEELIMLCLPGANLLGRCSVASLAVLVLLLLGASPLRGQQAQSNAAKFLVYIGTYTGTKSKGIYACRPWAVC